MGTRQWVPQKAREFQAGLIVSCTGSAGEGWLKQRWQPYHNLPRALLKNGTPAGERNQSLGMMLCLLLLLSPASRLPREEQLPGTVSLSLSLSLAINQLCWLTMDRNLRNCEAKVTFSPRDGLSRAFCHRAELANTVARGAADGSSGRITSLTSRRQVRTFSFQFPVRICRAWLFHCC